MIVDVSPDMRVDKPTGRDNVLLDGTPFGVEQGTVNSKDTSLGW